MAEFGYGYAAITKSKKHDDGTLTVYGKATDDSIDVDKQICDETWLKRAMPDWMLNGGNIREQHSSIAAGVATEYEHKEDGHYITALVVDPVSVKKVEAGVLKGFSIGIRSPRVIRDEKAAGGRIVDGIIVEVSLVDRPANPNAKLMLAKAAENGELMSVEQIETPDEAAEVVAEEVVESTEPETATEEAPADIIETAKSALGDLLKFDQATYDAAIGALSDLIVVEANEMKAGSDERESIKHLLHAIKHLFEWYEGEAEEGEVADVNPEIVSDIEAEEGIFLAADGEALPEAPAATDDAEKCEDCGEEMKACKCADKSVAIDPIVVDSIVEKAIASAREAVMSEVESLKSALEAEKAKSASVAVELEQALNKAATGGPKRAAQIKPIESSELLNKAAEYRAKADATSDRLLKEGYKEMALDFERKAKKEQ